MEEMFLIVQGGRCSTRIAQLCPCCGGAVRKQKTTWVYRHGFAVWKRSYGEMWARWHICPFRWMGHQPRLKYWLQASCFPCARAAAERTRIVERPSSEADGVACAAEVERSRACSRCLLDAEMNFGHSAIARRWGCVVPQAGQIDWT